VRSVAGLCARARARAGAAVMCTCIPRIRGRVPRGRARIRGRARALEPLVLSSRLLRNVRVLSRPDAER